VSRGWDAASTAAVRMLNRCAVGLVADGLLADEIVCPPEPPELAAAGELIISEAASAASPGPVIPAQLLDAVLADARCQLERARGEYALLAEPGFPASEIAAHAEQQWRAMNPGLSRLLDQHAGGPVATKPPASTSVRLAALEAIIERSPKSFVDVGEALAEIRGERMYLDSSSSFEEYCQARWGFSRIRAHQLIDAARMASTMVSSHLAAPTNERQARELGKVPEAEREQVWRETLERTGGKPTAAAIREVAATPAPERDPEVKPEPTAEAGTERPAEVARAAYRELALGVDDTNAAVVAVAVIEHHGRDVDDATCGAIARAVIAEHRAGRKARTG
jgi:hypothetical protein